MLLNKLGRESDEVIHDDVNGAANGVSPQVGKVKRFRPNPLARESRVAMHNDGNDFVQSFPRTVDVRSAQTVARLLRAHPADGDWIDSFAMARLRTKMDA